MIVTPSRIAHLGPVVEIQSIAANVKHEIQDARAAQSLSTRPIGALQFISLIFQVATIFPVFYVTHLLPWRSASSGLRHSAVVPVERSAAQNGRHQRNARYMTRISASFQQKHGIFATFRQPWGHHRTGRTRSDLYKISNLIYLFFKKTSQLQSKVNLAIKYVRPPRSSRSAEAFQWKVVLRCGSRPPYFMTVRSTAERVWPHCSVPWNNPNRHTWSLGGCHIEFVSGPPIRIFVLSAHAKVGKSSSESFRWQVFWLSRNCRPERNGGNNSLSHTWRLPSDIHHNCSTRCFCYFTCCGAVSVAMSEPRTRRCGDRAAMASLSFGGVYDFLCINGTF